MKTKGKLPNALTVSRFFLTVIFAALIVQDGFFPKMLAAVVFLTASLTDFFDGYYAKKHSLTSNFGKLMDPIADKFLILAAFFIFSRMHLIAFWMFVLIGAREILVTALRLFMMIQGEIMPAERAGKYKTVSQMIAICVILIFIVFKETHFSYSISPKVFFGWQNMIFLLMGVAVALTLISGILYLWNNRRLIHVKIK